MRSKLFKLSLVSLVCVLLVILAGSVVRMTGSGMGCPDWPKCFGYYIPPSDIETLTWRAHRDFQEGNIIIYNESLLVASANFTSGERFEAARWAPYTKHDYAAFNPVHTWIEFINRLIGAFTGLPVLILLVLSIFYFRRDFITFILSLLGLLLLGFEAWLGKVVVDGNLVPHQITYHMFGAVALVAVYVFLAVRLKNFQFSFQAKRDRFIVGLGALGSTLLLLQIYLGTSVRENVDAIGKTALLARPSWLESLDVVFEFHRSFSLMVLAVIIFFSFRVIRSRTVSTLPRILGVLIFLEVLVGMGLAYFDLPAFLQPVHLLFAVLDFGLILATLLIYLRKTKVLVG